MSDKTEKAIAEVIGEDQPETAAGTVEAELPAITLEEIEEIVLPGDAPDQADRPGFRIADDDCADWALRKISEERAERDRIVGLAQQQIARLQEEAERAERRYSQNTDFLTGCLAEYFRSVPHRKTKSTEKYRLLHGTLTLKLGKATPKPNDETLVAWLKQNGHDALVKTEEKPKWGDLKKLLTINGDLACMADTGEIVEGVIVEQSPDVFTVDL